MPVETSYPAPQADRLDKVCAVIDAVAAEANTTTAIAACLQVVDRQGAYYANAAAYLGLIAAQDTIPVSYALTASGADFAASSTPERAQILLELVGQVPAVHAYLDGEHSAATAYYRSLGLDERTAARRASTAGVWCQQVTGGVIDTAALDVEAAAAAAHAPAIAAALRRARRQPDAMAVCSSCFEQLPRTGVCDNCA